MSLQGSSDQLWDAADNDSFSKASTCYEPSIADTCDPSDDVRIWMDQMNTNFEQPLCWLKDNWHEQLPHDILKAISNDRSWTRTAFSKKTDRPVYRPADSNDIYPAESLQFQTHFGKAHSVIYQCGNQFDNQHDKVWIEWEIHESLLSQPEDPGVTSSHLQSMHNLGMASLHLLLGDTNMESQPEYDCQLQPDGMVKMVCNWYGMGRQSVTYKAFPHLAKSIADANDTKAQQERLAQSLHDSVRLWWRDLTESPAGADPKDAKPYWT